jgi:alpha-L-fucosidase
MSSKHFAALSTCLLAAFGCAGQDTVEHPPKPDRAGVTATGPYDYGVMGPAASAAVVEAAAKKVAKPIPAGPFQPSWASVEQNYRTPSWFEDAKFGIFFHWGVFSVAAHHNEWYEKHMYAADAAWHADHFGPQEKFGYKDLIPLFTASKWDPAAWAALFKDAGARMVMEMGEHHDNFAEWDSDVTPFNSVKMGPHRDLVGDLATEVRKQGMKVAISNHGVENFTFIAPNHEIRQRMEAQHADLFDPKWADFYNVADRSDAALTRFLTNWVDRNDELIDKYRPDLLWFDNGANLSVLDPLKLRIAAYYYNQARQWGKEVSLSTKFNAYAPSNDDTKQIGSIIDFEKVGPRSPTGIRPGPWMVDDTVGNSWGYIDGLRVASAESILAKFIDTVSKGGLYLLNISPMADGTIPQDQQDVLRKIGAWLKVNGDAIYGTRPWEKFSEAGWHFTAKGPVVYAIATAWPGDEAVIASLGSRKVSKVQLRGSPAALSFTQDSRGLRVALPAAHETSLAYALRIE